MKTRKLPPYGRKTSKDLYLSMCKMVALNKGGLTMVEVGTTRGEGEAQSNGWSTLIVAEFVKDMWENHGISIRFTSVDISQDACNMSMKLLKRYGLEKWVNVVCEDALSWIVKQKPNSIDAIYIDGWDYHAGIEHESEVATLEFTKLALPILNNNAIIMFDDVFDRHYYGKGRTAIPHLISQGWLEATFLQGQVILLKGWLF